MPIFYCLSCGKRANVPESSIGKRGKCKCGADILVPAHDEPPPISETQVDEPPPLPAGADEPPPLPAPEKFRNALTPQPAESKIKRRFLVGGAVTIVSLVAIFLIWILPEINQARREASEMRALEPILAAHPCPNKDASLTGLKEWALAVEMYEQLVKDQNRDPREAARRVGVKMRNSNIITMLRDEFPEAQNKHETPGPTTGGFAMTGTLLKRPDTRQPIVAPEESPSAPIPSDKLTTATVAPMISAEEIEKSFPKVRLKPIIAPPAISAQDEKLKQQLIEQRAVYAAGKLAGIKLPPEVIFAPGLKAHVTGSDVRGEDVEAIRNKLDAKDWLGALQIVNRNIANGVPSESDIDDAVTALCRKRMMVLLKGDLVTTADLSERGPIWIVVSRSGQYVNLRKSREFQKHPDGIGLLHSWRIEEGRPLIAFGVYRDVQRSLEKIEQTFRDKSKVWADKKRLGEVDAAEAERQTDALFAGMVAEVRNYVATQSPQAESTVNTIEPKTAPQVLRKPIVSKQSAKALMNMANQYRNVGDLTKAKEYANRVLAEYPEAPESDDAKSLLQIRP